MVGKRRATQTNFSGGKKIKLASGCDEAKGNIKDIDNAIFS